MFPVGNKQLSEMKNSNGSDKKKIKNSGKANHNLKNYTLFCRVNAVKQKKNFKSFETFVHLKC